MPTPPINVSWSLHARQRLNERFPGREVPRAAYRAIRAAARNVAAGERAIVDHDGIAFVVTSDGGWSAGAVILTVRPSRSQPYHEPEHIHQRRKKRRMGQVWGRRPRPDDWEDGAE